MTNTPMTFEEWFAQHDTLAEYSAKQAWLASQAQQASVIAELVEALEEVAPCLVIASDHYYDLSEIESPLANKYNELHVKLHALIAKVKGK